MMEYVFDVPLDLLEFGVSLIAHSVVGEGCLFWTCSTSEVREYSPCVLDRRTFLRSLRL